MSLKRPVTLSLLALIFLSACWSDDADYKSGLYWMNERDNWQSAAQAFERSLARSPNRWKTNLAMADALSRGDDPLRLENHVVQVFNRFPDSTRSSSLITAASTLLGEDQLIRLGGAIELKNLEKLMVSKGDQPALLARAVIAACRAQDQPAVSAYLGRLLDVEKGEIPDSVRAELNFFIGPAQLDLIQQTARLAANPDDPQALLSHARASLLSWDLVKARNSIERLAKNSPDHLQTDAVAGEISCLWDILPFESKIITAGWDGSRSSAGTTLLFLRDLGTAADPDKYIFRNSGGADLHTMKAAQQGLREIALPRLSPDGSWVYFYSSNDKNWSPGELGRFHLYRVKPTYGADPIKLTDDDLIFCQPYLEQNGTVLLVRRDVGSVRQSAEVIRIDPGRKRTEAVIRIAEPVQWAAFTANADSLLFITGRGVFKRSLAGGAVTIEMAGQGFSYPLLSPDGRWFLVQGPGGEQVLFDRSTGGMIYLGIAASPMGWFGKRGELLVTRKDGKSSRIVEIDLTRPLDVSAELLAKIGAK